MIRNALFCLPFAGLLLAASASAGDLQVDLHGIRVHTGTVRLAVVDGTAGWDGKAAPVQAQRLAPSTDDAHVVFKNLPAGDYAVLVTHDENDNGTLDTNIVGIPVEGYGFSNNPQVQRKPTFDEARVHVPADGAAISIALR
ncbi:DUF2141 domain-containing protein [Stenotrophomonas sp. BIGb0135]|jgi:uncharacterized protein (DUF2141 family)|uniref:DUF2141 domain-containing protein n=1 Tax=Stenotrophomonas nematodicola TaxID=2656746 RepID=A0ABW7CZU2_9GAMM|nr:DUF2141 domain-containing protein [Stenotrophomonas sp. BIGb0135]MCS4236881.1 uncharacterized protein (DUF2141 family) [Stenotrophomonas sp. BIGb0135]